MSKVGAEGEELEKEGDGFHSYGDDAEPFKWPSVGRLGGRGAEAGWYGGKSDILSVSSRF